MESQYLKERFDNLDENIDDLKASVKSLNYLISGNGHPENGVSHRLLVLEENQKTQKFWLRSIFVTIIAAVVGWLVK